MVVRKSGVTKGIESAGYVDAAAYEEVEKNGEAGIKAWIDDQLKGTTVTIVLVGANTCASKYVKYEIAQSIARGNGLMGIDISQIPDFNGNVSSRCGAIPTGYSFYRWNADKGYENLGDWVEKAAKAAGK
jgi:hypothetical protein